MSPENQIFAYARTKAQIRCAVSAPLFLLHGWYNSSSTYTQNFKILVLSVCVQAGLCRIGSEIIFLVSRLIICIRSGINLKMSF